VIPERANQRGLKAMLDPGARAANLALNDELAAASPVRRRTLSGELARVTACLLHNDPATYRHQPG
jgi:hypothetical protein